MNNEATENQVSHEGQPVLAMYNISRIYNEKSDKPLVVLNNTELEVWPGEIVALVGPSGSGKSTFLHIAGLLEPPTSGEVIINGVNTTELNDIDRTLIRRNSLGFVYQFHHLLPEFNAIENIVVPQMIAGMKKPIATERSRVLLDHLGLSGREKHRPAQLSGGEQQRVAIARALANEPLVLLADEPTGNLDPRTAKRVFDSFIDLVRDEGLAAIIATHNLELASRMDRVILLHEGQLIDGRDLINAT